jgi:hypothetical protein
MDKASEAVLALKPVSFRYKHELDPEGIPQFGLVAEEVEKVNLALVARDADGKAFTVRYEAVNAMLLNEFLKEHRKVEQLEGQIAALTADLQKVSAQARSQYACPANSGQQSVKLLRFAISRYDYQGIFEKCNHSFRSASLNAIVRCTHMN